MKSGESQSGQRMIVALLEGEPTPAPSLDPRTLAVPWAQAGPLAICSAVGNEATSGPVSAKIASRRKSAYSGQRLQ
jgi:hypothetical protein